MADAIEEARRGHRTRREEALRSELKRVMDEVRAEEEEAEKRRREERRRAATQRLHDAIHDPNVPDQLGKAMREAREKKRRRDGKTGQDDKPPGAAR